MTLRLKDVLVWLGLFALFPLGMAIFATISGASAPVERPVPPLGPTLGDPAVHAGGKAPPVTFADESVAWNWTNTCQEEVLSWLATQGYGVSDLTVILVDNNHTLPLGVVYPGMDDPDALALAGCEGQGGALTCRVAVGAVASAQALDTAVSVALVYGVEEHFRSRERAEWLAGAPWRWSNYQPLIHAEEETWVSTCLKVTSR